ncbi:lipopolysaccharide biosynthesis protein [Campylobacter concisus]|jgi:polysaccharide biosynthesis protein|uniref:lipopolysaccharide biosynthesis protein n=1 Tax=Campylobacter concisus TaxID=199 RepID=UPI00122C20F9|nr:oligosaccharide flippase family protein [Campylobacter concisus]
MKRELLSNSLIYIIGNIMTKGLSIVLLPIYTKYITAEDYGLFDLIFIASNIVNILLTFEISIAIARFYQSSSDIDRREYVSTAFIFILFTYTCFLTFALFFSKELTLLIFNGNNFEYFSLACFVIFTNGIFYFIQGILKWEIKPLHNIITSVVNALCIAIIAIPLLLCGFELFSLLIAQILANATSIILAFYYSRNNYSMLFNFCKFKELIKFSYPFVFSSISIFIANSIDRVAIGNLLGLKELGIYSIAYRFASVVSLVMVGFQWAIMPLVSKYYNDQKTKKDISIIFSFFSVCAIFIVCASILFSNDVLFIFVNNDFYESAKFVPWLVMVMFFSTMYVFFPGIFLSQKTVYTFIITLIAAVLNTSLNYTLIPYYGLYGSVFSTLLSSFLGAYLYGFISIKLYRVTYSVVRKICVLLFIIFVSYFLRNFFYEISLSNFIIKCIFALFLFFTITLLITNKEEKILLKLFYDKVRSKMSTR